MWDNFLFDMIFWIIFGSCQVTGWPPIHVYRRNSLGSLHKPSTENLQEGAMEGSFVQVQRNSLYAKVKMNGVPICRKVDMNAYGSYGSYGKAWAVGNSLIGIPLQ